MIPDTRAAGTLDRIQMSSSLSLSKQVVVIGSGATAMTIVPALADDRISVTMLQRSPTFVRIFAISPRFLIPIVIF